MKSSFSILALVLLSFALNAQVPSTIAYQGKLTTPAGIGVNDTVEATFRIYPSETDGTPLWIEHHAELPVFKGLFDVMLGEIVTLSLSFDRQYWLEITINGWTLAPGTKAGIHRT